MVCGGGAQRSAAAQRAQHVHQWRPQAAGRGCTWPAGRSAIRLGRCMVSSFASCVLRSPHTTGDCCRLLALITLHHSAGCCRRTLHCPRVARCQNLTGRPPMKSRALCWRPCEVQCWLLLSYWCPTLRSAPSCWQVRLVRCCEAGFQGFKH
jgi:hypothetical protein